MSDTTIDEILNDIVWKLTNQNIVKYEMVKATSLTKQAKSALYDLILKEVVGEDIPTFKYIDALVNDKKRTAVNKMKAEQRNKLKELMK